MFSPAVITSKRATDHMAMVKERHGELVMGIQNHVLQVAEYQKEKGQQLAEATKMKAEQDKQFRDEQAKVAKEAQMISIKQQELDLKERALTME